MYICIYIYIYIYIYIHIYITGTYIEGGGGKVPPALFGKLEKIPLIWRKNVLIVVIYVSNFSFQTKFLRVPREKTRRLFSCKAFLSNVVGQCLLKCPNSEKPPLP